MLAHFHHLIAQQVVAQYPHNFCSIISGVLLRNATCAVIATPAYSINEGSSKESSPFIKLEVEAMWRVSSSARARRIKKALSELTVALV